MGTIYYISYIICHILHEVNIPISSDRHLMTTADITPLIPGAGVPPTITPHTSCRMSTIIIV